MTETNANTNLTGYQIEQLRQIVSKAKWILQDSDGSVDTVMPNALDIIDHAHNIYNGYDPFGGK